MTPRHIINVGRPAPHSSSLPYASPPSLRQLRRTMFGPPSQAEYASKPVSATPGTSAAAKHSEREADGADVTSVEGSA